MRAPQHARTRSSAISHLSVLVASLLLAACSAANGGHQRQDADVALSEKADAGTDTPVRPAGARPPTGFAWVVFGADTVRAEVAATQEEREEGLMYRDDVPDGTGMLFVFQDNVERAFWMANTYVALDVAYLDPSYRVVDIIAMEPLITDSYPSDAPAMFALEVRQGWFAEHGIEVGSQAEIVFGG